MKTLKMIIFLMLLSTICTLFLASGNYTYLHLSSVFKIRLYGTILEMFEIEAAEEEIESVFYQNFDTKIVENTNFYLCKGGPSPGTIIFKHDGPGLWSTIEILIAVEENREKIYRMRILSQKETPGLGARIVEEPFLNSFQGIEIRPEIKLVKLSSKPNEVDAISGATETSNFLETIINEAIVKMDQSLKEGD